VAIRLDPSIWSHQDIPILEYITGMTNTFGDDTSQKAVVNSMAKSG
jgi:hypothetical protein